MGRLLGPVVINGGTVENFADEQILDSRRRHHQQRRPSVHLNGFTETLDPLTLNGGVVNLAGGTLILSGNVKTDGLGTASSILDTVGGGTLDRGSSPRSFTVGATDTLFIEVPVSPASAVLNADGPGTLDLDALFANACSGDTNVSGGGTLVLDNVQGPAVPRWPVCHRDRHHRPNSSARANWR